MPALLIFPRIICQQEGYPEPQFFQEGSIFKVILRRLLRKQAAYGQLTKKQRAILDIFESGESLSLRDIAIKLNSSLQPVTLRKHLMRLKGQGLLRTTGRGVTAKWSLIN